MLKWMLLIFIGLVILIAVLFITACKDLPTVNEDMNKLPPGEKEALNALFNVAQIKPDQMRNIGLLGLEKNPRAVVFKNGHVIALRLSETSLEKIDLLDQFPELEALWLDKNRIKNITGLNKANRLEQLVLDNNQITSLAGLENCTALTELQINNNGLTSLQGISALQSLKKLSVSNNKLEKINEISGLPHLAKLIADHNSISSLVGLSSLPQLDTINLSNNRLIDVSPLKDIVTAKNIDLSNNQIKENPDLPYREVKLAGNAIPTAKIPDPPANYVKELPELRGYSPHTSLDQKGYQSVFGYSLLSGTLLEYVDVDTSARYDLEHDVKLSVEEGKARVYLLWPYGGYIYADAEPGKPASIRGRLLMPNTSISVKEENRDKSRLVVQALTPEAKNVVCEFNW